MLINCYYCCLSMCRFFILLCWIVLSASEQIRGTLEAPSNRSVWLDRGLQEWITFEGVDRLHVLGGGTLNGNGQQWWNNSCKVNKSMVSVTAPKKFLRLLNMPCFSLDESLFFGFLGSAMRHRPDGTSLIDDPGISRLI